MSEQHKVFLLFLFALAATFAAIITIAVPGDAPHQCAPPPYDVDRVMKMHEELRQCASEKEECEDNVRVCASLLRRCLE